MGQDAKSPLLILASLGMALLLALVVAVPLLFTGEEENPCADLGETIPVAASGPVSVKGVPTRPVGRWAPDRLKNAAYVIAAGKALGISARGQQIAVMTAMGESSLTVVDHGDTAGPDSRGLFQQRANGAWGSYADRMNPTISATSFYKALMRVPGWETLTPTQAAHQTQRNADPNYYTQFWNDALNVTSAISGKVDASQSYSTTAATPADCGTAFLSGGGSVVSPVPAGSGYTDQRNWHQGGSSWGSWHTGTDFSAACGTPVVAATAGKIVIRTDQSWSGRWLVQVSTGASSVSTWYAHMRAVNVKAGQYVTPGQQIGEVGDLGNSTGCHLHFEVHETNGSIYGPDNVNPTSWLAAHVGKTIPIAPVAGAIRPPAGGAIGAGQSGSDADGGFRLVTFNILGASHTAAGGKKPSWASGSARVRGMVATLNAWGTDVAALQEVASSQRQLIEGAAGGGYTQYPAPGVGGDNRLVWRTSTFQLERTASFKIPYFNGRMIDMPVVLLRQRSTGKAAWFISVHNPADTRANRNQGRYRTRAIAIERQVVKRLSANGTPVFLMGDLNARADAFCPLTAGNLLRSASGGSGAPVCRPPAHAGIDWIFGAGGGGFTAYQVDRSPVTRRVSDHPIVISQAHIG